MKVLYLDCGMGAAGDMLAAALMELLPDPGGFIEEMNGIGVPGAEMAIESVTKCGILGTRFSVKINGIEEGAQTDVHTHKHADEDGGHHGHGHAHMKDIEDIIDGLAVSAKVKKDILSVYGLIAEAEGRVHGKPVAEIHFHEVGAMDAIADIAAVCLLMDRLSPDLTVVSPVHVGSGHVKCAHGVLPVPAPATVLILEGAPIYGGDIKGELCTPTGAALLRHFASKFGNMPVMKTKTIGYGMGKKDFDRLNCVRAMLGEANGGADDVIELSCNVDDMTAEEIGFAMDRLFDANALEAYTMPIGMKKSRPGTLIKAMCRDEDKEDVIEAMFKHTTTIGIREERMARHLLDRRVETVETPYGDVRCKYSCGFGAARRKYEYDDVSRIAANGGESIYEVREKIDASLRGGFNADGEN